MKVTIFLFILLVIAISSNGSLIERMKRSFEIRDCFGENGDRIKNHDNCRQIWGSSTQVNDTESEENVTTEKPSDDTDDDTEDAQLELDTRFALDVPIQCPTGHRLVRGNCKKRKY
ncbi:CLUMA_CG001049, isoform A [Clunio marinus]|uniref:CLUMA_CG001049, isoform A n=1 Tax=Clunio marinus TaxID=568069 RepID=A0A1J1HGV8_9DIPT|nr:CLUMA_CG001049, isoform A [Clunio marinus]